MNARALTLAWRGLRVDVRRPRTYALRIALVAVLFLALVIASWTAHQYDAPGLDLFRNVYLIDVLAIIAIAATVFSTAITEEKELQTLGLLRLAGFSSFSVLLGKSAGQLVTLLTLLLVQLPFVLLSVTLGGVSTTHVVAAFAALGAFAVFAGALGLCASTLFSRSRTAASATTAVLLTYSLLPLLWPALPGWDVLHSGATWLREISIWFAFDGLAVDSDRLWVVVLGNLALGGASFLIAWAAFDRRSMGDRGMAGIRTLGLPRRGRATVVGPPIVWKDVRFLVGGWLGIAVRFFSYGAIIAAFLVLRGQPTTISASDLGRLMFLVAIWGGAIDACIYAGRMFHEEIQWRTLPVLLTIPGPAGRIVLHKLIPVLWVLLPPACVAITGALLAPGWIDDLVRATFESFIPSYLLAMVGLTFILTLHLSLSFRRGAFAIAAGSVVGVNITFAMLFTATGQARESTVAVLGLAALFVAVVSLTGLEQQLRDIGGRL